MCGIVGYISRDNFDSHHLQGMIHAMHHRGPDSQGEWFDKVNGVALGHARLSILDLSAAGHQPMLSFSERYVVVFNGEIYNHADLRCKIESRQESVKWRGHSDTETLLAGFEVWGIEATIKKCIGMFAFGVWDRQERVLTLGRDRLGEKPLYYGWQRDTFVFGSDLHALSHHPSFKGEVDRNALALFMRYNYIPAPYSIYRGISKVPPASIVQIRSDSRDASPYSYWNAEDVAQHSVLMGSTEDVVATLEHLLKDAVAKQMMADVPLGAFLSGGVDSSTVVALMQAQSSRPVKTFTIGFHEQGYNEAEHAKQVARHLGTDHTELYVTPQQALDVIPNLPKIYSEPFADSSQIPTFLVSQLARQHVTVSLSGDAGDELFGGYNRYILSNRLWSKLRLLPIPMRRMCAQLIQIVPPNMWNLAFQPILSMLPPKFCALNIGDKLHKGADVMASKNIADLYRGLVTHWSRSEQLVIGSTQLPTVFDREKYHGKEQDALQEMMAMDLVSYLPDDILAKVDRAAMGVSLETRVPFLDHRVVEFATKLPMQYKLRNGVGKWALRQVLYKYVPPSLIERPKMGFGVPIDSWLRGPLREWAENLLNETRLKNEGYFQLAPIRQKWTEHLSGKRNWQYHLWDVLMFQAWKDSAHATI